jgi:hypothetical protein
MPDDRRHRGPHPDDARLFTPQVEGELRSAVADLSWLLTRHYATPSALKIVGDRYNLTQRQRTAVMRSACSEQSLSLRTARKVPIDEVANRPLLIDGYNVLTTIEAALSNGVLILGRDGALRDMASIHGTYRKVEETIPALALVGAVLDETRVAQCTWYLDAPVSNSGRLKTTLLDAARAGNWTWQVELVPNPDAVLIKSNEIVATADSVILDRCGTWFGLAAHVVRTCIPDARLVQLG